MMSRALDEPQKDNMNYPTFVKVLKSRLGGDRTFSTAVMDFNIKKNEYLDPYRLGKLNSSSTEWQETEVKDLPYWARNLGRK